MTAPTITSLRGVNPYDPSSDFLVTFDGMRVYASTEDYWLVVLGTHLDTVTDIAFTKTGEVDRPVVHFNIISSTRLEVMIPMTVLSNSYVTVTNPDGTATSARNVTPVFAGAWLEESTVTFDTDDFGSDSRRWADIRTLTRGATGAKTIGPNQTAGIGAPPLRTYDDVIDNPDSGGGAGVVPWVANTITNSLYDDTAPTSGDHVDDIEWNVVQTGVTANLSQVFYSLLADLGVPGYWDTGLLPADAVEAIPDGTDLQAPFFDDRFTTINLAIAGYNDLRDNYAELEEIGTSTGTNDAYIDVSAPAAASREDIVEFRVAPTPAAPLLPPDFQSTSDLTAAALLGSLTVPPVPPLRVPADQEAGPPAPILADPVILTATLDVLGHLTDSIAYYTVALTSYRTYDEPPDPGDAPVLTWTWMTDGGTETLQGAFRTRGANVVLGDSNGTYLGVSERRRHVQRIQATWDPPRYRYWYTTPHPFTPPDTAVRTLRRRQQAAPVGSAPRRRQIANRAGSLRRGPGATP